MTSTIYASFANPKDADKATGALMDYGLHPEDISVVANVKSAEEWHADRERETITGFEDLSDRETRSDNETPRAELTDAPVVEGQTYAEARPESHAKAGISTTTGADAGAGAAKGAAVGLGVGVAAAIASVFLPGIGLVLGGGAIAAALVGAAGATGAGAIAGGAFGYMKDQGVPADEITTYQQVYTTGGAVLAISIREDIDQSVVESVLAKYNAQNMKSYGHVMAV
jgi:hypothetical protein